MVFLIVFGAVCAAAALLAWAIMPGESNAGQRAPFWGVCCAHRGLYAKDQSIPENSLPAFIAAADAGYGIELDIQLTRDGEVVVFHDDDLQRACGVFGRLDSYTYAELQAFSLFETGHRIPLLSEVLKTVNGGVPIIIELKTCRRRRMLCDAAWRILRLYDGDICVESFDPRIVRLFKKYVPGLLRGQLAAPPRVLKSGAAGYLVGWGLCHFLGRPHFLAYRNGPQPPIIRLARRFAMRVVWTAGPGDSLDALQSENDAIIFEHFMPEPRYLDAPVEPAGGIAGTAAGDTAENK